MEPYSYPAKTITRSVVPREQPMVVRKAVSDREAPAILSAKNAACIPSRLKAVEVSGSATTTANATTVTVSLERSSVDDRLGLALESRGTSLRVNAIGDGIMKSYNDAVDIRNQIRPGDFIIAVNGVRYSDEAMLLRLRDDKKFTLDIKRPSEEAESQPQAYTVVQSTCEMDESSATRLAPPLDQGVPAQEESEDSSVYTINIIRDAGTSWGLGFETGCIASRLEVAVIVEDGLFHAWNQAQDGRRCLFVGDEIIGVNDKVTAKDMLEDFKELNQLCMKVRPLVQPEGFRHWLDAAEDFELNEDFDISASLPDRGIGFQQLMGLMKTESAGKKTIQALGDKILLSQLLDNLEVPQMPMLFTTRCIAQLPEVREFVNGLYSSERRGESDAFEIVIKPTHLSNAAGALILSKERWRKNGLNADKILKHMNKFLAEKADDGESEALKSLIPGFIVQPCYQSRVEFKAPLEMRVVTIWGKARLGIWWWGRKVEGADPAPGQKPQRTAWLVRKSETDGLLNHEENWEVLHDHEGSNKGFEKSLLIFLQAMPAMAAAAEAVATAVGAPFLRSDFFVGSEKWGIRLNEVAYGSGVDCRSKKPGSTQTADDSTFIARVLQEGFKLCKRRPADVFLEALGARGSKYEDMTVSAVVRRGRVDSTIVARPRLPSSAVRAFDTAATRNRAVSSVAESECDTVVGGSKTPSFSLSSRGCSKEVPPARVISRCPVVMETRTLSTTTATGGTRGSARGYSAGGLHFPMGGGSIHAPMGVMRRPASPQMAAVTRPQTLVAPSYMRNGAVVRKASPAPAPVGSAFTQLRTHRRVPSF